MALGAKEIKRAIVAVAGVCLQREPASRGTEGASSIRCASGPGHFSPGIFYKISRLKHYSTKFYVKGNAVRDMARQKTILF